MCNNQILYQSKQGCVSYCAGCGHIQLIFGTVAVFFKPPQFQNFCDYMLHFFPNYDPNDNCKKIWIPISQNHSSFILNGAETDELRQLLQAALKRYNLRQIIGQCQLCQN
jgi:hypothetical protein